MMTPDPYADLVGAPAAGQRLAQELDARGWTQADFAEILGRPAQFVSEVVTGKKEITRESAAQFGAALGTSAEFWLGLQQSYHLRRQAQDPAMQRTLDSIRLRARLKRDGVRGNEATTSAALAEEIAAAIEADVAYFDTPADCAYAAQVARDHAHPKEQ